MKYITIICRYIHNIKTHKHLIIKQKQKRICLKSKMDNLKSLEVSESNYQMQKYTNTQPTHTQAHKQI